MPGAQLHGGPSLPRRGLHSIILNMNHDENAEGVLEKIGPRLARIPAAFRESWRADLVAFRNWLRSLRDARLDYVVLVLEGTLPERASPPRSFIQRRLPLPPEPLSLETLNRRLQAIADADNVKGAVFVLRGLTLSGLARAQNLRRAIERLRNAGKEAIVFTPTLDLAHYYVACAADRIVIPPGTHFEVLGLRTEVVFLKDALQQVGLEAEVFQISPYKTAGNVLDKSEMTPEQKEQLDWLLDDTFDVLTADMAHGRDKTQGEIKALIDEAPHFAREAVDESLVDHVAYEDELASLLAQSGAEGDETGAEKTDEQTEAQADEVRATLLTWKDARRLLREKVRHPTQRYVGVVSLEGMIAMGRSRQPPVDLPIPLLGGALAGEETISTLLRRAERSDEMAALVFYVDSGGGLPLASDLIWRQLKRLATKKPVLAYMGDVAASGGYYVTVGAQRIMSQPGTTTGSIGVLTAHLNAEVLDEKLSLNRTSLKRGRRAGLYREVRPLNEEERQILWEGIEHTYEQFMDVVAEGRGVEREALDEIAGGRVWTGRQAKTRGLVDDHGDFLDAIRAAAEMAGLPTDDGRRIRVANLHPRSHETVLPQAYEPAQEVLRLLRGGHLRELNGKPLTLIPYRIRFH